MRLICHWILMVVLLGLLGCSTIHYHFPGEAQAEPIIQWHHLVFFDLIEVSPPQKSMKVCKGRMPVRLTSRRSALGAVIATTPAIIGVLIEQPYLKAFWSPWELSFYCPKITEALESRIR